MSDKNTHMGSYRLNVAISIGGFEISVLGLVVSILLLLVSYLTLQYSRYTSIGERQTEMTNMLDGNVISYAYSGREDVHENREEYSKSLSMEVRSPRVFQKSQLENSQMAEFKEKYLPKYQRQRYTRVQTIFQIEASDLPDLYDICIFSQFLPAPYTGDFSSVKPENQNNITVVNRLSPHHFELEIASDSPPDVNHALDTFYAEIQTALVRKELLESDELDPMIHRDIKSRLREMLDNFEEENNSDHPMLTGPALRQDILDEFRKRYRNL